jgi:regulator of protease activity HflC (stomatin/prohibitin superfamily)
MKEFVGIPVALALDGATIAFLIVVFIILIILIRNIRIVPQATDFIIERFGGYHTTWTTGIHMKIPFVDRVAKVVSLKEKVADFMPQAVITKDNVTMQIDTVLFYQVVDPKLFAYGIENPILAIENLSATTLRNIIGDLELDECLTSRDLINTKMRVILDEATDPWGIKVNRVELKNILPPREIQNAMEKQMKAEREKRESILRAEGEKEAAIRVAEGQKTAAILRAEAKKESQIREAEGEALAIMKVQEATAQGLKMIKDVHADQGLIAIKSLETLAKLADGRATKIIIPSEIQGLAGLAVSLKEMVKEDKFEDQPEQEPPIE